MRIVRTAALSIPGVLVGGLLVLTTGCHPAVMIVHPQDNMVDPLEKKGQVLRWAANEPFTIHWFYGGSPCKEGIDIPSKGGATQTATCTVVRSPALGHFFQYGIIKGIGLEIHGDKGVIPCPGCTFYNGGNSGTSPVSPSGGTGGRSTEISNGKPVQVTCEPAGAVQLHPPNQPVLEPGGTVAWMSAANVNIKAINFPNAQCTTTNPFLCTFPSEGKFSYTLTAEGLTTQCGQNSPLGTVQGAVTVLSR